MENLKQRRHNMSSLLLQIHPIPALTRSSCPPPALFSPRLHMMTRAAPNRPNEGHSGVCIRPREQRDKFRTYLKSKRNPSSLAYFFLFFIIHSHLYYIFILRSPTFFKVLFSFLSSQLTEGFILDVCAPAATFA